MRSILEFNIDNIDLFAQNLSVLIDTVEVGIMLRGKDNISIPHTNIESRFDILAGINYLSICKPDKNKFDYLQQYIDLTNDWILGYLSYDLKNDIENLTSKNIDELNFPELFFFQPEVLLLLKSNCLYVHYYPQNTAQNNIEKIVQYLKGETQANTKVISAVTFTSRYTKSEYLKTIEQVKKHIARGDIYEMNLCQEFFHRDCSISPAHTFNKLYSISPTPFATFLKVNDMYLMSASPERYIRKDADIVVSQPIKGTAARKDDVAEDALVKEQLKTDTKERAENIMIVDLVRNDLSKVASRGSVFVNELCGIYSFKQVHQMISTVTCKLQPGCKIVEPIKATFPMGSMTGAPKVRAMQLIEEFERTKRGLFSGSVGYITPQGNFDFNVVIRSLLYNKQSKYLSFSVGGAITFNSEPEKEYNECLLKAKAILSTLNATIQNAE